MTFFQHVMLVTVTAVSSLLVLAVNEPLTTEAKTVFALIGI